MATDKIDLFKELKTEYATPKKPVIVETTPGVYLSVSGKGEPGGDVFQEAIGALYGMAYTLKFTSKQRGRDYKVAPLEGLYWGKRKVPTDPQAFRDADKADLHWQLMIRVPDFVGQADRDEAAKTLREKGKGDAPARVERVEIDEGRCVQMLHVGPYDEEHGTLEAMTEFQRAEGLKPAGVHHEIYLSDPRRVPPERLRTILRVPVKQT